VRNQEEDAGIGDLRFGVGHVSIDLLSRDSQDSVVYGKGLAGSLSPGEQTGSFQTAPAELG
jgi:hypothetical protein